ncbi:MAG: hypothetical protein FWH04_00440 [Oscillospiraceae bacterium]|nr:hypothetical protein [Oscillospiraceae bacterium]
MKRFSLKTAVAIPSLAVLTVGVIILVIIVGITASSATNGLTHELLDSKTARPPSFRSRPRVSPKCRGSLTFQLLASTNLEAALSGDAEG